MTNLHKSTPPEGIAANAFDPRVKPKFTGGNALFGFGIIILGLFIITAMLFAIGSVMQWGVTIAEGLLSW